MWFDLGGWWLTCDYMYPSVRRALWQGLGGQDHRRLRPQRRGAACPRRRGRPGAVLQHGHACVRRQVSGMVAAAVSARDPAQLRVPGFISHGHVDAPGADDPARGRDRHPGTPFPASLDAESRPVSELADLRRPVSTDCRGSAQDARRADSRVRRGSQLGFGPRSVAAQGAGQKDRRDRAGVRTRIPPPASWARSAAPSKGATF